MICWTHWRIWGFSQINIPWGGFHRFGFIGIILRKAVPVSLLGCGTEIIPSQERKENVKMKKLFALLLALAMILGMAACAAEKAPETTDTPVAENPVETTAVPEATQPGYEVETLKMAGGTDWGVPSPYLNVSRGPGQAKMRLVFASLLEKDENGDVPWLAESWSIDGNNYIFTLFADAKFHDGTPITTADVAFTLDYFKQFPPVTNTLGTGDGYIVESYEVIDERTISITVKNPTADMLSSLGSSVIIPKHIWENVEDPYAFTDEANLIGSGAYMCTAYEAATGSYEFTAFADWCNGQPAAERILFVPVSDALLAFENGEIDITSMPADLADVYLNNPEIGVVEKTNDSGYKMLINFEKCPEFLDLSWRQAMYAALDRQSMLDNVFRGMGSVGSAGYVPRDTLFYNENCVEYTYNPEAAKAVFDGKGIAVTLLLSDSATDIAMAEIIKNNLEAVGISVETVAYDSATRDEMINEGEYEFAIVSNGGWGNNPPTYMRTIFSDVAKNKGGNPHSMGPIGYSNDEITKLCEDQRFEVDFEARKDMFKQIQLLVSEEIPLFVLANQSSYSMFRKDYYDGWMKTYAYAQCEQNRLSFMSR